jgi:hypothetical protein
LDSFIHPAYNPVTDYVSELSLGQLGWLQTANFLVFGAAMLTFATGIRWGARRGRGSAAGPLLFVVIGAVGLIVDGIFKIDPHTSTVHTLSGTIHSQAAPGYFFGVTAACFVFARRFRGPLRVYSIASGILLPIFIFGFLALGIQLGISGLLQRGAVVVGNAWITVLALMLWAEPSPPGNSRG